MSPTQVQDPTDAEAMAIGGGSSMETPSSASATGGGGLQHAQVHQEVDGVGSGLELVPAGQPEVYGPATSTVVEEVNPFWSDRVKDEVALRAVRPSFLPVEGGNLSGGGMELVSPL